MATRGRPKKIEPAKTESFLSLMKKMSVQQFMSGVRHFGLIAHDERNLCQAFKELKK